jgi:PAS domain S-box-containing protein
MNPKVKIIFTFCLSILMLTLISIYSYTNAYEFKSATDWVAHTQTVINEAQKILTGNNGSSVRGYVITGNPKFIEGLEQGLKNMEAAYLKTKYLTQDNPNQQFLLDSIHRILSSRTAFTKLVITARRDQGFEYAQQLIGSGKGDTLLNKARDLIAHFINNEKILLAERYRIATNRFLISKGVIITSILTAILIILVALYFFIKDFNIKLRYQNELKTSQENFQQIFNLNANPIYITDMESGCFMDLNSGFEKLLCFNRHEAIGKTAIELNIMRLEEHNRAISIIKEKGYVKDMELKMYKKGGDMMNILVNSIMIDTNGTKNLLTTLTDISALKITEKELREAKELVFQQQIDSVKTESEIERLKNVELKIANQQIEEKSRNILDSIEYAKYIQETILAHEDDLMNSFPDSFVLYKPKDIVSGDFYWHYRIDGKIFLAMVDCSGHGVPGAFMTIAGNNMLENIIKVKRIYEPEEVLLELNNSIANTFYTEEENIGSDSGMDISFCSIDIKTLKMKCASAHQPIYIIRNEKLTEIKADKITMGNAPNQKFEQQEISLAKGDIIYLFSDGYVDQKGGKARRKFYYKPFMDIIIGISNLKMAEQREVLEKTINDWMINEVQIDDITVIGIRV